MAKNQVKQKDWFNEVSYEEAKRLFNSNTEVFCLYDDDSEGKIENMERIEEHNEYGGRFGVE